VPDVKHGSLFAGIGGFDLGFDRAGMETAWQVENERNCQTILEKHWPAVERLEDVRECGRANLRAVDVISGGFPCQDLSVAGRREGLAGERSGLWHEFARIVEEMEARWVVVENVPGLLSSAGGDDFALVVGTLEQLGYCVAWRVLDSQFFGVPQRRRRVFIVGSLGDGGAIEVLFEHEGGERDSAEGGEKGKSVAYALAASVRGTGDGHEQGWNSNYVVNAVTDKVQRIDDSEAQGRHLVAHPITGAFAKHHGRTAGNNCIPVNMIVTGPLSNNPTGGMDTYQTQLVCGAVSRKWAKGTGGPSGDEAQNLVASPVTASAGHHGHSSPRGDGSDNLIVGFDKSRGTVQRAAWYEQSAKVFGAVRRLTPTECERLQGFPDGWTEGLSDTARYKCLGNAVTVNVAEWIGKRIVAA
jgi:DNA (cytosine-5)-methyltransferase 1